mgnify:CR=1 FL=1
MKTMEEHGMEEIFQMLEEENKVFRKTDVLIFLNKFQKFFYSQWLKVFWYWLAKNRLLC